MRETGTWQFNHITVDFFGNITSAGRRHHAGVHSARMPVSTDVPARGTLVFALQSVGRVVGGLAVLVAAAVAVAQPGLPAGLFSEPNVVASAGLDSLEDVSPNLHRAVGIDFAQLGAAQTRLAAEREARLTLNLFDDLTLPATLTNTTKTSSGYALSGRLDDDPLGMVSVVVNGRTVAGNVWSQGKLYTVRTRGDAHFVEMVDPSKYPRCDVPQLTTQPEARRIRSPSGSRVGDTSMSSTLSTAAANEDDGAEIDVLVVYTPAGRRSAGGYQGITALIELLVAETNQAYSDSGAEQRIRLVGVTEVDYEILGIGRALRHLTEPADGHMDEVHRIRDIYAADLVLLWSPSGAGQAWHLADPSNETAERFGFSVSASHYFSHELGHNMGLLHERSDDNSNAPYPYSHGYVLRHGSHQWRTIMYSGFSNLLRFSNPRQRHPDSSGSPLGVPGDQQSSSVNGPADAVRSLNNTRRVVANFRASSTKCDYELSDPSDMMGAEGGTFTIDVRTSAACRWTARTHNPDVSITGGANGTGNGRVTFDVAENDSWPRELAVLVAGEVYVFTQDGRRSITPVCDRTSNVRDAISTVLDGKPCGDIVGADLARIGSLSVDGPVMLGDFDGLTSLGTLHLHFPLSLEAGLFAGLQNLQILNISNHFGSTPEQQELKRGVFQGLAGLERLSLSGTSWQPGVFHDLPVLLELNLYYYPLEVLPDGAFRGLSHLQRLHSQYARLTTLGLGAFKGMPNLRVLWLWPGRLEELAPGVFQSLPALTHLWLNENRLTHLGKDHFRGCRI